MSRETKFGYGFLLAGVGMAYLVDKMLGPLAGIVAGVACLVVGIFLLVAANLHRDTSIPTRHRPYTATVGMFIIISGLIGAISGSLWILIRKRQSANVAPQKVTTPLATTTQNPPTTQSALAKPKSVPPKASGPDTSTIGNITQGPNSALSLNQQGGITAGTYIGTAPCPWKSLKAKDYIAIASQVSSTRGKLYIAMHPSDDDASRFASYIASALDTYGHWDTSNFEGAHSSSWALYPGITIIVRDPSDFDDNQGPASKLKIAIESVGLKVHTKVVPTLNEADNLGLWVGSCE